MARRGAWQLNKMVFNYCDWSGSSRGARDFVQSWLPRFRQENPHLQIEEVIRRGRHPWIEASYLTGNSRSVTLRNMEPTEILRQAAYLRSSLGRKTSLVVKQRTQTKSPSIQGSWTPELQSQLSSTQSQ